MRAQLRNRSARMSEIKNRFPVFYFCAKRPMEQKAHGESLTLCQQMGTTLHNGSPLYRLPFSLITIKTIIAMTSATINKPL